MSLRVWLSVSALVVLACAVTAMARDRRPEARTCSGPACPSADAPDADDLLTYRQGQFGHWRDTMLKR